VTGQQLTELSAINNSFKFVDMLDAAVMARQFRAERKENDSGDEQGNEAGRKDNRLRAATGLAAKGVGKKNVAKAAGMSVGSTLGNNGAKVATNRFLSAAWLSLIPSFGFTLIWINIHVLMHAIVPAVFGKLGEEWVPGQAAAGEASGGVKSVSKGIGLLEITALIFLDILAVLILVAILGFLMFLLDSLFGIFGWLFDWFMIYEGAMEKAKDIQNAVMPLDGSNQS